LLDLLHLRAQHLEAGNELSVTALDSLERAEAALSFRGKPCGNQRHSRAQIAAIELPAFQFTWPGHNDSMRVT
jgi:hypothetical protein